jgi:hypothetical protein
MNRAQLKELVKNIMSEESEYQAFFQKALEKAGKSIPSMSDDEKKVFFNKIDSAWDGKGEKNEGNAFGAAVTAAKKAGEDEFEVGGETYKVEEKLVGGQKKLDVDGDGEIESSDLADLRAGKKADEGMELPKATIPSAVKSKLDMAIDKIKDSDLTYNQKVQVVGQVMDSLGIDKAEFNKMTSKLKGTMESVNESRESDILAQIEKLRVAANSGKITGAQFQDKFYPLWKELKTMNKNNESVNEANVIEPKDDWGVRLVVAINNNVSSLHTAVIKEKQDVNKAVEVFGNVLKNAIKETLKHKYKPHPKAKDADNQIKTFISELKKFEKIVDILIAKPTKVGITKLDDAWRSIWNYKYGAKIGLSGELFNSIIEGNVNEGVSSADMDKIKGAVEAANSFMSVGSELKKLGMKYTFATEPLPIYIIQPTPNNKVAIVNKKYATKPDFVVGDIAVGIMESKSPKPVNEGRAFINAARKAKKEGLTEFEFNGKKYPVTIKD